MPNFIAIPPEKIAHAKELYESTSIPIIDLAVMLGISQTTFMNRVRAWGWRRRNRRRIDLDAAAKAGIDINAIEMAAAPAMAVLENETLINRVRSAVEREIVAIEAVLTRVESARLRSPDAERAARTLATLVKTLREVAALQRDEKAEDESVGTNEDEFRDLEEFREQLAERLDRLRRERNAS